MEQLKKVKHQEIMEFVYETKEQRTAHIDYMEMNGWETGSRVKRLKPEVSIMDAREGDHEWYADFWKYH